jgi:hypothetical protein
MTAAVLTRLEFLDGKLATLATSADGFVNASISATTDETNNLIPINHANFALITNIGTDAPISRI